jgi:hypothetical protein
LDYADAVGEQAALRATVGALDISAKAGRVMQELLNSEREYFTDLGMLQRLYVKGKCFDVSLLF